MRKLIVILAIILTSPAMGFATVEEVLEEIKTNTDIAQGFKKVKEFDTWNKWRINNKAILKADKSTREHVLKIVDKSDKHPVRFGKQSLRFEVRDGDCFRDDFWSDLLKIVYANTSILLFSQFCGKKLNV